MGTHSTSAIGSSSALTAALSAQTSSRILGNPFLAGYLTRRWLLHLKGQACYETRFLPKNSPITLAALLFTIIAMFRLKSADLVRIPTDVVRIAIPLTLYFLIQFS